MVLVKATGVPEAGKNFGMRECYRYITSHDDEGKAVFVNEPPLLWQEIGQVAGSRSYGIASIPARLHDDNDLEAYLDKDETNPTSQLHLSSPVVPAGVGITVVNFKPGASTGMHRTVSLDCSVCLEGHISMEMDSGQIKELFPGVRFRIIFSNPIVDRPLLRTTCRITSSSVERLTDGSTYQMTSLQD
jgi:hypothetical protein